MVVAPVRVCVPATLNVPLNVSEAPANVPLTVGALSAGLVASTALPLPVVAALTGCPLAFVPRTVALAGIAPPLILPTIVAPCVPVTSPLKPPVKFVAVVAVLAVVAVVAVAALVALATAVAPIALTISAAVAAAGGALACQYPSPVNGVTPPTVALVPLWL